MVVSQRSLLGSGEPAIDAGAAFDRIQLDERAWVDVSRTWLHGADTLLDRLIEGVAAAGQPLDVRPAGRRPPAVALVQGRRGATRAGVRRDPRGSPDPLPGAPEGPGLNYYRDGRDSVAPHRDRELRHLDETLIAIVTLGAQRPFLVKPCRGPFGDISPASGDLLVMGGRCQVDWEHGVPKVARAGTRISCTWRWSSRRGPAERSPSWRSSEVQRPDLG